MTKDNIEFQNGNDKNFYRKNVESMDFHCGGDVDKRSPVSITILYVIGPGDKTPGDNEAFYRKNVESMDFH